MDSSWPYASTVHPDSASEETSATPRFVVAGHPGAFALMSNSVIARRSIEGSRPLDWRHLTERESGPKNHGPSIARKSCGRARWWAEAENFAASSPYPRAATCRGERGAVCGQWTVFCEMSPSCRDIVFRPRPSSGPVASRSVFSLGGYPPVKS